MKFLRLIFTTIWRALLPLRVNRTGRALAFALLIAAPLAQAQINEYEVKAAFLFNFALFTQPIGTVTSAPPQVPPAGEAVAPPYRICIHGKDPFAAAAKSLVGRKVAGRVVLVLQDVGLGELKTCQMIFIGEQEREAVRRVVNLVNGFPIITVIEAKEFPFAISLGVMFNLILVDEKVAFQVNTVAAKNQQLDVSAKLIRLAKNVH